jgi:hypothetical protein
MTPEPKFRDPVHALLATQYLPPRIRTSNRDPQTPVPSPNQDPPRIHGTYPYLHVEIIKTQVERRTPPHQCVFFFWVVPWQFGYKILLLLFLLQILRFQEK